MHSHGERILLVGREYGTTAIPFTIPCFLPPDICFSYLFFHSDFIKNHSTVSHCTNELCESKNNDKYMIPYFPNILQCRQTLTLLGDIINTAIIKTNIKRTMGILSYLFVSL